MINETKSLSPSLSFSHTHLFTHTYTHTLCLSFTHILLSFTHTHTHTHSHNVLDQISEKTQTLKLKYLHKTNFKIIFLNIITYVSTLLMQANKSWE